jgi:molybdenum cofactor cytidylyltransferase
MTACADRLDPSIAVALLAAGKGERFAGDKLCAVLDDRPLWLLAAEAAERAGFASRLLIASADNAGAFEGRPWNKVVNPRAAEGMGTSVACAAEAASDAKRLVLILADMPFVEPDHLRALALGEGVMFTRYPDGRRGIPAGFPASAFARLRELQGDRGASAQTWGEDATALAPVSPESLFDIDTADDLALARARIARPG